MKPFSFSGYFQFRKIELISLLGATQDIHIQATKIITEATKTYIFKGYSAKIKSASGEK